MKCVEIGEHFDTLSFNVVDQFSNEKKVVFFPDEVVCMYVCIMYVCMYSSCTQFLLAPHLNRSTSHQGDHGQPNASPRNARQPMTWYFWRESSVHSM